MKPQDRIDQLNAELATLRGIQSQCVHAWRFPATPETRTRIEAYGSKIVRQGVDSWTQPEGYHDVPYPVWVRTCAICGLREETEKVETVVTKQETRPVFPS